MRACLMIIKGEVCHVLKLLRLVGIGLLRTEVVHTAAFSSMPLAQELLHLGHWVAVQSCARKSVSTLQ